MWSNSPKNALVKQYQRTFTFEDAVLEFEPAALRSIAVKAIERGTGARGLRSIMEGLLLDTMYELPSLKGASRVIVTEATVESGEPPVIDLVDGAEERPAAS